MSTSPDTTAATTADAVEGAPVEVDDDHHPTAKEYIQIAVVLAVLTALEISASFIEIGAAFLPTLLILMAIKFVLVAGWFMHLKFDTNVYKRFMVTGLILAGSIYTIVLVTFRGVVAG